MNKLAKIISAIYGADMDFFETRPLAIMIFNF